MEVDFFLRLPRQDLLTLRLNIKEKLQLLKEDHKYPTLISDVAVKLQETRDFFEDGITVYDKLMDGITQEFLSKVGLENDTIENGLVSLFSGLKLLIHIQNLFVCEYGGKQVGEMIEEEISYQTTVAEVLASSEGKLILYFKVFFLF